MKKYIHIILFMGLLSLLISCAGGGGGVSVGVYRHHHGFGPWWGSRTYYRDRIIVVPPEVEKGPTPELPIEPPVDKGPTPELPIEPPPIAEQLPEPPMDFPDMGMPDIDLGDFGD